MGVERHSIILLDEIFKEYGHLFSSVRVICNMHWTENSPDGYSAWQKSETKTKLEKKGALSIYLPGLHKRVTSTLFKDPDGMTPFYQSVDKDVSADNGLSESERLIARSDCIAQALSGNVVWHVQYVAHRL